MKFKKTRRILKYQCNTSYNLPVVNSTFCTWVTELSHYWQSSTRSWARRPSGGKVSQYQSHTQKFPASYFSLSQTKQSSQGKQLLGMPTQRLSAQFSHSVLSDSLQRHELQHTRLPCPSPIPGTCPNSCPSSWWCQRPCIMLKERIRESSYFTTSLKWVRFWILLTIMSKQNMLLSKAEELSHYPTQGQPEIFNHDLVCL